MAGLIENNMLDVKPIKNPLGGADITGAKSFGYDPTLGTVNDATDSVSGQLAAILGKDSPYITRARAGATQAMNARGLINTTMAGQAGEAAAIDAALPIASQDANTYSTQRLTNQQAGNAASQFGAGAANQAGIINAQAGNRFSEIGAQTEQASRLQSEKAAQATTLQTAELAGQQALQALKGTQATGLADIEAGYKGLIQANDSAARIYTTLTQMMTAVMSDATSTPEQKQAGVDRLTGMLKAGLTTVGSIANIDLVGLLTFA